MNRASLLGLVLALPALGVAFFACQKEDPRPPVSDGPGVFNPNGGSSAGNDGSAGEGGTNAFASFPAYQATGVAADGDTTYVTLRAHDTTQPGQVVRVDPNGTVTVLVPNAIEPVEPAVGNETLYYVDRTSGSTLQQIMSLSLTNVAAGPQPVVSGLSSIPGITVGGDLLYFTWDPGDVGVYASVLGQDGGGSNLGNVMPPFDDPGGIAVDANNAYFVAAQGPDTGELVSVPLTGGTPDQLLAANGVGSIISPVVVNNLVYFVLAGVDATNNGIYSVPTTGGTGARIAAPTNPEQLAVSDTNIYYSDFSSDPPSIYKGALTGDAGIDPVVIGSGGAPTQIAVGATAIYVAINAGLLRLPR